MGIPTIEDKIVQMGIKRVLEAIFEVDFIEGVSYGFRPGKSCPDALDALEKVVMTQPVNYVVDMDIERFFDTIDHAWLMECLKQRVADSSLLRLIVRFLKAGCWKKGRCKRPRHGHRKGA